MPKAKPLSKQQILGAVNKTKSNRAAARYLGVSYIHYKKWAKNYDATEEGYENIFEQHKNQSGKGIPKFLNGGKKTPAIVDIIEGRIDASSFNPDKLKFKLIESGYMVEQCYWCGFNERRDSDAKIPLIMFFKDGNKHNYRDNNCQLSCYNCYFLRLGNVFTERDMESLEGHQTVYKTTEMVDFQLDDYHQKRLKELGLGDSKADDDPYSLVSRKV